VKVRQSGSQYSIDFFGVRRQAVARSQSCLNMSHQNLIVESSKGSAEGCSGVALNNDHIGALLNQVRVNATQSHSC
jgi:hypothetical protein